MSWTDEMFEPERVGLNPYSTGRYSVRQIWNTCARDGVVLILILLEDTL